MPQPASPSAAPLRPTPTSNNGLAKIVAEFDTLTAALDYAARGVTGFNFYSARGDLKTVVPFRELRDQAMDHALRLSAAGLKPGDRVALLAATDPKFIVHFFACQYAGITPVPMPLPTAFGRREAYISQIRNQIISATPRMLFGPNDFLALIREAAEGTTLSHIFTFDDAGQWTASNGQLRTAQARELSYIQYSSGSTRFPTGVCVTHDALMKTARP